MIDISSGTRAVFISGSSNGCFHPASEGVTSRLCTSKHHAFNRPAHTAARAHPQHLTTTKKKKAQHNTTQHSSFFFLQLTAAVLMYTHICTYIYFLFHPNIPLDCVQLFSRNLKQRLLSLCQLWQVWIYFESVFFFDLSTRTSST